MRGCHIRQQFSARALYLHDHACYCTPSHACPQETLLLQLVLHVTCSILSRKSITFASNIFSCAGGVSSHRGDWLLLPAAVPIFTFPPLVQSLAPDLLTGALWYAFV
jgi:hypothetical protein